MTAVNGAYTAMWNHYLNDDLKFTSTSAFTNLNDQAFANWDFGHIDPTGAQKGKDAIRIKSNKSGVAALRASDRERHLSHNLSVGDFQSRAAGILP